MSEMTKEMIETEILVGRIGPDGRLFNDVLDTEAVWFPGEKKIPLLGVFKADELEAIAWWMRNIKEATL